MKTLILSTSLALGLGAIALAPASAAPLGSPSGVVAPALTTDVACRTVEKRVRSNGVTRITRTKQCDSGPRMGYGPARVYGGDRRYERRYDRRDYRRNDNPGLSIRVN